MKLKLMTLMSTLFLVAGLAACGGDAESTTDEAAVDAPADSAEMAPEADEAPMEVVEEAPVAEAPAAEPTVGPAILEGDGEMIEGEGGLVYVDLVEGDGAEAAPGSNVAMRYVGTYENGEQFDASVEGGPTFDFTLGTGAVIKGWDMGIVGMKAGGKRRLWIPSELAYGAAGHPAGIPPNTPLVFEVELVSAE
jgi:FKBP-type peptidyl-prolyl cis-trans isomerase